ncbi:MAG TPA: tetratricopeptide repeat protein [Thermoanaerobaculia bacterium]|nr:tetratricopeptide repeat protein [Thermoanaerobaculia bacterium]
MPAGARAREHEAPAPPAPAAAARHVSLYLALGLALLTVIAFRGGLRNGFVNYDDPEYVTESAPVRAGLTAAGLRWAATAVVASNWHPVTLLSHMLDCQLYGLDPRGHHLTSLLLHLASTLLLFEFLRRATGRQLPSAAVAALFAVHPTHVESVAWIAERKDVLCGFFWMLTLVAYHHYVRRPTLWRYLAVALACALSLAAKPMAVTLPFVLLLLDYWPLGRLGAVRAPSAASSAKRLWIEKLPLVLLAAATAAVALETQRIPLAANAATPLPLRLANALTSYVAYLGKALYPVDLAVIYPLHFGFHGALPIGRTAAALALLLAISLAAAWARRAPYLLVGWLWYLGTLVPVIGIVQAGRQAMADRYTYLPAIGIYLALAWGVADLAAHRRLSARWRAGLAAATVAVLALLTWASSRQTAVWADSITLFRHALAVEESYPAHANLADALAAAGDRAAAAAHFRAALALEPANSKAYAGLGGAQRAWGEPAAALATLRAGLVLDPASETMRITLAAALDDLGRDDEAIAELERAARDHPRSARAHHGLAALYERRGGLADLADLDRALAHYRQAIAAAPEVTELYAPAADLLARRGDLAGAADLLRRWLAVDADAPAAHARLAELLDRLGQPEAARRERRAAEELAHR